MQTQIDTALARLSRAVEELNPIGVYGLFSGGHDSFSACYIASLHPAFAGIVHINTGIGIRETRVYVRDTCERRGWPLHEYKAIENVRADGTPDPQVYADIVRKHGFPGPHAHRQMYTFLKERQLRRFERDIGASARGKNPKRVLFVSGSRSQESRRRMGHLEELYIDGRRIWSAPILDWSKSDTTKLLILADQPRNKIVDRIHKSGECLCGAFAKPGELAELAFWPETREAYDYIRSLEDEIGPLFGWDWEGKPPRIRNKDQQLLPGVNSLCWSCDKTDEPAVDLPLEITLPTGKVIQI